MAPETMDFLLKFGVNPKHKGFDYIGEMIESVVTDAGVSRIHVTKDLYPKLAEKHDVSVFQIERATRIAIKSTFDKLDPEFTAKYFGNVVNLKDGEVPTNATFIAVMARHLYRESFIKDAKIREDENHARSRYSY